jgi:Zn-dependent protease
MAEAKTIKVGLWLIFVKLGAKILPAIMKVFSIALKTKGGLAALSFAGYSAVFTWQFALILMISLGIHEAGHVWAMRRCGIPTRGFYFIPFIGGAAVPDRKWHSQREHLYVALMGPVWGAFCALAATIVYLVTENVLWAGISSWIAVLNLINLLPVYPLDGGRVLHSVVLPSESRAQRIAFLSLMVVMIVALAMSGLTLFMVIGLAGLFEVYNEDKEARKRLARRENASEPELEDEFQEQESPMLEGLPPFWRLAGLHAWFTLATSLAIIVIFLGSVPGAGPALEALQ